MRQLADSAGRVTLRRSYDPYGNGLTSSGIGASSYGFTGEWTDNTGLVYLRARYYAPGVGRFTTRDTWPGEYERPLSLNGWMYVEGNVVNWADPSGHDPWWNDPDPEVFQKCLTDPDIIGVNSGLQQAACKMVSQLVEEGYLLKNELDITSGLREPDDAHVYATAYGILHDMISMEALKATQVDADGNQWYPNLPFDDPNFVLPFYTLECVVKFNASYLGATRYDNQGKPVILKVKGAGGLMFDVDDVNFAYEGYPRGDPRRLPNTDLLPVSKHVSGYAVDIFGWTPGQEWNSRVDVIASFYSLVRPFNKEYVRQRGYGQEEYWHFEPLRLPPGIPDEE